MSPTKLFEKLGIPLANPQWSWGASNRNGVVLRVWQDSGRREPDGFRSYTVNANPDSRLGSMERQRHLAEVRSGKPLFLVVCQDVNGGKDEFDRKIRPMKDWPLFSCEPELLCSNGETRAVITKRLSVESVRSRLSI